MNDQWGATQHGEFYNPDMLERVSNLETFTGIRGVNGLAARILTIETKLDKISEAQAEAARWRWTTALAALSSMATLGTLIVMVVQ